MTYKQFVLSLATYYKEPLLIDGRPNIKLSMLEKWAEKTFKESEADTLLEKVLVTYMPTSAAPFPLIPHIAEIMGLKEPTQVEKNDSLAKDSAGRIVTALSKFGYTNSNAAKNFIGELGWQVVEMQGGWDTLCQSVEADQLPIYQAQWRDLAKSLIVNEFVENQKSIGVKDSAKELN